MEIKTFIGLLDVARNLEKNTEIKLYSWKIDFEGKPNSADCWDDIAILKSAGLVELNGENAEITERGRKTAKNYEAPEGMEEFLKRNYSVK